MKSPNSGKVRDQPFTVRSRKLGTAQAPASEKKLQPARRNGSQPKHATQPISYAPVRKASPAGLANWRNDLLIRGLGGSVQIDLGEIGIDLHPEAFAFQMPDDSLLGIHIRRGDIAILEPCIRQLREGDLVLLRLEDTGETLRRITYCGSQMFFQMGGCSCEPLLAAWQHPFYGVVTALLRPVEQAERLTFPREQATKKLPRASGKRPMGAKPTPNRPTPTTRLSDEPPMPGPLGRYVA